MGTVLPFHDPFASDTNLNGAPFPVFGPDELADLPAAQVDWIVKGLLARGSITTLASDVRAGKTTFDAEIVRACLEQRPFLGLPTQLTHFWWLTEEMPPSFFKALLRAQLHLYPKGILNVVFRRDVREIPWPELVDAIVTTNRKYLGGGGVLLVDTLTRFAQLGPEQEN